MRGFVLVWSLVGVAGCGVSWDSDEGPAPAPSSVTQGVVQRPVVSHRDSDDGKAAGVAGCVSEYNGMNCPLPEKKLHVDKCATQLQLIEQFVRDGKGDDCLAGKCGKTRHEQVVVCTTYCDSIGRAGGICTLDKKKPCGENAVLKRNLAHCRCRPRPATCGNGSCEVADGEDCDNCEDCYVANEPCSKCGDDFCDYGEDCPADCDIGEPVCNDGICEPDDCPDDCDPPPPPVCGDGECEYGESCEPDCGPDPVCGDGVCDSDETCDVDCPDENQCGATLDAGITR